MDKYEEIANKIIDWVCDVVIEHYDIEPKPLEEKDLENPALINGTPYYDLECEIADFLKKVFSK